MWRSTAVVLALFAGHLVGRRPTLPEVRESFATELARRDHQGAPLATRPAGPFTLVEYDAPSGPTAAYLTRLDDEGWELLEP